MRTLYIQANLQLFYRRIKTTIIYSISSFLALFGSYRHDGDLLTSSSGLDTMLNSFPLMYQLIVDLSNDAKANANMISVLQDISSIDVDIDDIAVRAANPRDNAYVHIYSDFCHRPKFDIRPVICDSYSHVLIRILRVGHVVEWMICFFDPLLTPEDKRLLAVAKDTIETCRSEVSTIYKYKLQLATTLSQLNQSDLMHEVHGLLEKNPFNKPS